MDTLAHLNAVLAAIRTVMAESEQESKSKQSDGHNLRAELRDMHMRVALRKRAVLSQVESMKPLTESERVGIYHGDLATVTATYRERTGYNLISALNRVEYERAQM